MNWHKCQDCDNMIYGYGSKLRCEACAKKKGNLKDQLRTLRKREERIASRERGRTFVPSLSPGLEPVSRGVLFAYQRAISVGDYQEARIIRNLNMELVSSYFPT